MLGLSLSCLAMTLVMLISPSHSTLSWFAFAIAGASLVRVNVLSIRLYDQAAQNRIDTAGGESESV
jgi:hypothetical protein